MRFSVPRRASLDLDLGPMVDVIFQLLIFFVLTSVAVSASIPLVLPVASTAAPQDTHGLEISINEKGQYFADHTEMPPESLESLLRGRLARDPELSLTLRGHKDAKHEHVVRALDAARLAGIRKVRIACEKSEGSAK